MGFMLTPNFRATLTPSLLWARCVPGSPCLSHTQVHHGTGSGKLLEELPLLVHFEVDHRWLQVTDSLLEGSGSVCGLHTDSACSPLSGWLQACYKRKSHASIYSVRITVPTRLSWGSKEKSQSEVCTAVQHLFRTHKYTACV